MSLLILGSLLFIALVFVLLVLVGTFGKIPDNQELRSIQNPMATEVYSSDGVLMGTYYIENRQFLEPSEIPEDLKHALIATEDVRFYRHKGIDLRSLLRVFFKTLLLMGLALAALTPTVMAQKETVERILDAAEALFAERGFAETSLRTITSTAGGDWVLETVLPMRAGGRCMCVGVL